MEAMTSMWTCRGELQSEGMGGMGLTSAVDIREPAWIGTWALVAGSCASCMLLSATLT